MRLFILCIVPFFIVTATSAQEAHEIPLGRTLQVEVPLEYSFKAGVENVRKTVMVKLEIEHFSVLHEPLKQFIEGGAMGMMYDEVNVTRWYSYTSPEGLYVDNEFIRFSEFLDNPASATFSVQNVRFTWTQGASRYAKFQMGSPSLTIVPKSETPGFAFDVYNLSQIVGTETGKEAFNIVKGKGAIVGAFLEVDGIAYRPPYELTSYLSQRDAQLAAETGHYTAGGVTNPVKKPEAETQTTPESINPSTSGNTSENTDTDPYEDGRLPSDAAPAYSYDPQAWAEFNSSQQQVKNWQRDFDRQITLGEQQRKAKAQAYDKIATDLATDIIKIANQIEARKEQQRINKRVGEINRAVNNCYAQLRGETDYWVNFQSRLIDFGNTHKNVATKQGFKYLENAINSIQNNLQGIDEDINELDKEVEHYWSYAQDMNDVFKFPLRRFRDRIYGKTKPAIGYQLAGVVNAGAGIPSVQPRSAYITDAAGMLAEFAVKVQTYDCILSAAAAYEKSNGSSTRYQSLLRNARAIKAYKDLKNQVQAEYDAFEKDLKSKKGLVILTNKDTRVQFGGVTPLVRGEDTSREASQAGQPIPAGAAAAQIRSDPKAYKHTMTDLFPRINDLKDAYLALKPQMGEFDPLYKRYAPDKIASLEAEGFYVEPGDVKLALSVSYMEPAPLIVPLAIAPGESKTIELANYYEDFKPNKYFNPFDRLDHKKERFNRRNTFKVAYTAYNMGVSEIALTLLGNQRYASMRSYQHKRGAFFSNAELARMFYGKSKITTGTQDATGVSYNKHTTDFSYLGGEVGRFGLGYAQRLFSGRGMLELQGAASFFSIYNFSVNATKATKLGSTSESASGNYKVLVANYAVTHGIVGLIIPVGRGALNFRYQYNFYPLVELQNDIGDKGDINAFDDEYAETYTPFYKDLFNNYFTHSLTVSFNF